MRRAGVVLIAVALAIAGFLVLRERGPSADGPPRATSASPAPDPAPAAAPSERHPLRGRVTANGAPVLGATVVVTRGALDADLACSCLGGTECAATRLECGCGSAADGLEPLARVAVLATASTGADGAFELPGLAAGAVTLWAHEGSRAALLPSVEPGSAGLELELAEGLVVIGRVTGDDEQPVPGARVVLIHATERRMLELVADVDGRFRSSGVPNAAYAVLATRDGLLPALGSIEEEAPDEGIELRLSAPRTLTVRVETDGAPVSGAVVHVEALHVVREELTGPDGRARFARLRPETYALSCVHGARRADGTELLAADGEPPEALLKLDVAAVVLGHVTAQGQPLGGATVTITGRGGDSVATAADGAYRLVVTPSPRQEIRVEHEGFSSHERQVELKAGDNTLDVALEAEAPLGGIVVDAQTREPVAGAQIDVRATTSLYSPALGDALSDDDGRFRITGLRPGRLQLRVQHDEHLTLQQAVQAPATDLVLALGSGLVLSGVVVDPDGRGVNAEVEVSGARGSLHRSIECDDVGAFAARGLALGTYQVSAESGRLHGSAVVTLPAKPLRLQLKASLTIGGVVVDEHGAPIADARLLAWGGGRPGAVRAPDITDAQGRFEVLVDEPGEYKLTAVPPGRRPTMAKPTLARAGQSDVRIVVQSPERIRGRLVGRGGEPISRFVVDDQGRSNVRGEFDVPREEGVTSIRFGADGYRRLTRELPPPGRAVVELGDVVLSPGREVRVTVTAKATGAPVAGARVVGDASPTQVTTDAQGVAVMRALPDGDVLLRALQGEYRGAEVVAAAGATEARVALERGASLVVKLTNAAGEPLDARIRLSHLEQRAHFDAATDRGGTARIGGLLAGRWLVMAGRYPHDTGRAATTVTVKEDEEARVELTLEAGRATLYVQIEPGPLPWKPTGVLLLPFAQQLVIRGTFDPYGLTLTAVRGVDTDVPLQFEVPEAPAGEQQLLVSYSDGKTQGYWLTLVRVTLEPVQRVRLTAPRPEAIVHTREPER